jgi:transketolase
VFSIDGHDAKAVAEAFEKASSLKDKPTVLLVRTVKGKGVSYMENDYSWHGKAPNDEQLAIAEAELQEAITLWEGRANG